MKVEVLYFEGCPNHTLAVERVREVIDALGLDVPIEQVNVTSEDIARAVRFQGSPTVRVDGQDVFPSETEEEFSMRCRVYPTPSGYEGAPSVESIRAALEKAAR